MIPPDANSEREQIEQAIAAQESLRGVVDEAIIKASINTLKEKLAALDSPPEQQRKLATILFMDIAGHTALTHELDPEDQMALVDPLISRLAEVVSQFGGHVSRFQGDGFKAVFGLPVARENDPEQAIRAGLAIQATADAISAELKDEHDLPGIEVRVGITTGLVFAGGETEGEDTIKGTSVNLAARLESAAEPGTVLISYGTYKHVRGIFDLEPIEPIQAKGFPEPVRVYRVLQAKPRAFYRGMRLVEGVETRMIGRKAELETLKDAYYSVVEERDMQMVTILGEAGLGKSRLLYEFENWVDLQSGGVRLYRSRAHLESQRLPYALLRSLFAFRFNIRDDDPQESVQEKWMAGFAEGRDTSRYNGISQSPVSDMDMEMRAHILGQLLGYDFAGSPHVGPILGDPLQMRDRSLVYLEDYFNAVGAKTAMLILLEDLHWADDSSLEALSRLGLRLRETPVLIVGAARPGFYERRPYWFEGRDFHRQVNLKPLSRRVNRQLVLEVLQKIPEIPDTLVDLIISNAEGNPFYVEELVKVLVESGVIVTSDLHWRVDEHLLDEIDVPTTLTGVLQARLERLPKEERILIQQASVVGRVFWDQAVWYLNHQGEGNINLAEIEGRLANLRGREMIYRRELSSFIDANEYIFKHAVLREVTYESVLKKLRRAYHALAAEWLMEQRGDRRGEVTGLIADHLEMAGEKEEALRYLRRGGEEAAGKYANEEAIAYFSRALVLVPEEELETRFELLLAREEVLAFQSRFEEQRQDLEELELLAGKQKLETKQMEVDIRMSNFRFSIGEYQTAAEIAERIVVQAEAPGNTKFAASGQLSWGRALIWQDKSDVARSHLEQALAGFKDVGDQRMEGITFLALGAMSAGLYDLEAWRYYAQQALSIARHIGDKSAEASAINHLGVVANYFGNYSTAEEHNKKFLLIAREIGSRQKEQFALSGLANMALIKKDYPSALDYTKQAFEISESIGNDERHGMEINLLGRVFAGLGRWDKAAESYQQAMNLFEDIGEDWGAARARNGLAHIALEQRDMERALDQVDAILNYLEGGKGLGYGLGPTESYLICVKVLQATGDPRAREVLEKGYTELQERAAKIKDEVLRRSFLENVPWNRELVKLWEEQQKK